MILPESSRTRAPLKVPGTVWTLVICPKPLGNERQALVAQGCAVLMPTPMPEELLLGLGLAPLGWLKILKASERNCIFANSPTAKSLKMARFSYWKPGPTRLLRWMF